MPLQGHRLSSSLQTACQPPHQAPAHSLQQQLQVRSLQRRPAYSLQSDQPQLKLQLSMAALQQQLCQEQASSRQQLAQISLTSALHLLLWHAQEQEQHRLHHHLRYSPDRWRAAFKVMQLTAKLSTGPAGVPGREAAVVRAMC